MQLRPYQIDAIKALNSAADGNRSSLLCLPTGGGKTLTALTFLYERWLKNKSGIVYWVAHRQELLNQASDTMNSIDPKIPIKWWDAITKPKDLEDGTLLLTMVQSTRTFNTNGVSKRILVIDEAHREAAKSYRELEEKLKPDYKFGLTATPYRLDSKALGFDEVAYRTTLLDLATGTPQYLAKPNYIRVNTELDFESLEVNESGDFTPATLKKLSSKERISFVARHFHKNQKYYGKTLIFWPDIDGSKQLVDRINNLCMNPMGHIATHIDADTGRIDRDLALKSIKDGKLQVVSNVLLFTEGIDIGAVNTIFMCRPTLSESLWLQCVGRGSRLHPGKTTFNIVDFVDNIEKYRLTAEELSVNLLGAPKDPKAQKLKLELENIQTILTAASKSEIENTNVKSMLKEAKASKCDLIGSIIINKADVETIYPLFHQDYKYLIALQSWLYEKIQTRDHKQIYPSIISSFTRIGYNSSFIPARWNKMVWGMVSCLAKGTGLFPNLCKSTSMKVKFYLPKPSIAPDLTLIDTSEPLTTKQVLDALDDIRVSKSVSPSILCYKYHAHYNIVLRKVESKGHIYNKTTVQSYLRTTLNNRNIYVHYE